jgi:Tol biopolymer transport system component
MTSKYSGWKRLVKTLLGSVVSLLLIATITGCSVEIQQTPLPTATAGIQPAGPTILPDLPASPVAQKDQIPVTWANLDLTGRLVYVVAEFENHYAYHVRVLDLANGRITTVFTAPDLAIIYDLAVSPDHQKLLLSYAPPPPEDTSISSRGIYIIPMDGSGPPQPLFTPAVEGDENFQVEWSADGKYVYYTNFNYQTPPQENAMYPLYTIYRISHPDDTPEKVAENSMWPSVSQDSSKIVYLQYVGSTLQNQLYVADADGRNSQEVVLTGSWILDSKDAPIFMPDGQSILFSGPAPTQAYKPGLLDRLMGVQIAHAHNVPSDWFVVATAGGEPTRLTRIQARGLFASISPDQKHIASLNGGGVFVMDLDGSNLLQLIPSSGVQGTVRWIP